MPSRIAQRGTGYEMNLPSDIGFDAFDNVYVLDRDRVLVFAPGGKLLTIFTPGTESALADPAFHADTVERIAALHRIGEPMEVLRFINRARLAAIVDSARS
jgi:NAD(P)-dependent dehydrogenase (short-subunit alcohol dehydrogenase family)